MGTDASAEGHHEQDRSGTWAGDGRDVVEQLRSAPAEQVIAEALLVLLNAAQIKLGRRDARLLIDLSTVMLEHAGTYLPERFGADLSEAQLPEPNDLSRSPGAPLVDGGVDDGYRFPLTRLPLLGYFILARATARPA